MEINLKLTILFLLPAACMSLVVACGDTQPLPDIDVTVEARVQAVLEATALSIPTVIPVSTVTSIPTATSKPAPPTLTPEAVEIDEGVICTLNDGEIVQKGWSGKDTGANYCNQCRCLNAGLACTKMACPSVKFPATPTPGPPTSTPTQVPPTPTTTATPTATPTPIPTVIPTIIPTATSSPTHTTASIPPTVTFISSTQTQQPSGLTITLRISEIAADLPKYDRGDWKHWIDEDSDCQNTRHEILIEESLKAAIFKSDKQCQVANGEWLALYTGVIVTDATKLDVDHMVPLKNAHDSGGWAWSKDKKTDYANEMKYAAHLIAVTASANRKKGAKGPEEWKPANQDYWCDYAIDWVQIKADWDLSVTKTEWLALQEMLKTCDSSLSITVIHSKAEPPPTPTSTATPTPIPDVPHMSTSAITPPPIRYTAHRGMFPTTTLMASAIRCGRVYWYCTNSSAKMARWQDGQALQRWLVRARKGLDMSRPRGDTYDTF